MLSQSVTKEFIFRQLDTLSTDGLVEVAQFIEFLQFRGQQPLKPLASGEHAAFGIWADYPDANDPAVFALKLRQDMRRDKMTDAARLIDTSIESQRRFP